MRFISLCQQLLVQRTYIGFNEGTHDFFVFNFGLFGCFSIFLLRFQSIPHQMDIFFAIDVYTHPIFLEFFRQNVQLVVVAIKWINDKFFRYYVDYLLGIE